MTREPTKTMTVKKLEAIVASPGFLVMVVGTNGHWASAKDGKTAFTNAKRPKEWLAFQVVDGTYLTQSGRLCFEPGDDLMKRALAAALGHDEAKYFTYLGESEIAKSKKGGA